MALTHTSKYDLAMKPATTLLNAAPSPQQAPETPSHLG
jgi:hypothetical protein